LDALASSAPSAPEACNGGFHFAYGIEKLSPLLLAIVPRPQCPLNQPCAKRGEHRANDAPEQSARQVAPVQEFPAFLRAEASDSLRRSSRALLRFHSLPVESEANRRVLFPSMVRALSTTSPCSACCSKRFGSLRAMQKKCLSLCFVCLKRPCVPNE